jgi:hypothetical protein
MEKPADIERYQGRCIMKIGLFSTILILSLCACQHSGTVPAIRVAAPPSPVQLLHTTPTINIITVVVPTQTAQQSPPQTQSSPIVPPALTSTADSNVDLPLLIPRMLKTDYAPQATRLVIGFDIHPAYKGKPGVFGEIYDATLIDQNGREIAGISMERTEPEKSTLEFVPVPPEATTLTLHAQLALRGIPAQAQLAIDVSGHPLDQAWSIQTNVHFGNLEVKLHTARLIREETGDPSDAKQQVSLELHGENADLNGAQLICLALSPLPSQPEGSMGCGQESGGIMATVSLGPVVDRRAPLPMPTGLVILQATADLLLPGDWVVTWPVER